MRPEITALRYVDTHQARIAAPRELVWSALGRYVDSSLCLGERNPLAWLLGTEPRGGFEITPEIPNRRLSLSGRHRFARYLLVFDLADVADGATLLSARTNADFPGLHGRVYRALVIGTRVHSVATRHMLRSIRELSVR